MTSTFNQDAPPKGKQTYFESARCEVHRLLSAPLQVYLDPSHIGQGQERECYECAWVWEPESAWT